MSKPTGITASAAGLVAALAACSASPPPATATPPAPIAGGWEQRSRPGGEPATVRFIDVEGGCWVIETAAGRFQPVDLPEKFRIDGRLVVVAMRKPAQEMASICQVGPLMHIESIRDR
jgi:hypothetical protein